MVQRISTDNVDDRLSRLADRVRDTHEAIVVEERGEPIAVVITAADYASLERMKSQAAKTRDWSQLVMKAHEQDAEPPPSEDEIVEQVRRDREARYRETYGRGA